MLGTVQLEGQRLLLVCMPITHTVASTVPCTGLSCVHSSMYIAMSVTQTSRSMHTVGIMRVIHTYTQWNRLGLRGLLQISKKRVFTPKGPNANLLDETSVYSNPKLLASRLGQSLTSLHTDSATNQA